MLRARELAQAELALARDIAAEEVLKKKESEKQDDRGQEAQQPNIMPSPPIGSGGEPC
jgi:hypothetical protein